VVFLTLNGGRSALMEYVFEGSRITAAVEKHGQRKEGTASASATTQCDCYTETIFLSDVSPECS